tara:strand:- start:112 stop:948 length:837 start_codon:yes stop_codon:yes gene_type:complete
MNINVLTYNMSWATQVNKVLGSESDFVKECQRLYKNGGKKCNQDAINELRKLPEISLMGIQEVNSKIEPKIKRVQTKLKKYERGTYGQSTVSILWDPNIFGKLIERTCFNLCNDKDSRPCLILLTQKGDDFFLLINVHASWEFKLLSKYLTKNLSKLGMENLIREKMKEKDVKMIFMGDFNDDKCEITKNKPLTFKMNRKKLTVKHNKTKGQLKKSLKSCCWHEKNHQWGHFISPGDYILTNENIKQLSMYIPKNFNKKRRNKLMFSDHKPVLSKLII